MYASHISAISTLPIKDFHFLLLHYLTFMLTWLAINFYSQSLLHLQLSHSQEDTPFRDYPHIMIKLFQHFGHHIHREERETKN